MLAINRVVNFRHTIPRHAARAPYLEVVGVPDGVTMMITELKCKQEGCPPFESIMVIMYGAAGGGNQKRRVHCRLAELTRDIVAAAWGQQESEEGYMPPGVLGGP